MILKNLFTSWPFISSKTKQKQLSDSYSRRHPRVVLLQHYFGLYTTVLVTLAFSDNKQPTTAHEL